MSKRVACNTEKTGMRCVKKCAVVRILLLHPGKSRAVNKNKVQVKPKNHSKHRWHI